MITARRITLLGVIALALIPQLQASPFPAPLSEHRPSSNPPLPEAIHPFTPPVSPITVRPDAPAIASSTHQANPNEAVIVGGHGFSAQTRFLIYGQSDVGHQGSYARVEAVENHAATLRIEDRMPSNSMYMIWPQNGQQTGHPVKINATEVWWINPRKAAAGETVSVYGRNLTQNNAEGGPAWVYVQTPDGAGQWAKVTDTNPYKVDFIVPEKLAHGDYEIWAHNGRGGNLGWSALHVGAGSPTAPRFLTVEAPWTWEGPTLDVKKFGAVGDGKTDDTAAILKALEEANSQPRSTLYFPGGTYLISEPIAPVSGPDKTGVRIKGDGMTKTFIKGNPERLPTRMVILEGNRIEVRDLVLDINELGESKKFYRETKRPPHDPAYFEMRAARRAKREADEKERKQRIAEFQKSNKGQPLPEELRPPERSPSPPAVKRIVLESPGFTSGLRIINCVIDGERKISMNLGGREDVLILNCDIVGQETQISTAKHIRIHQSNFYGRAFAGVLIYSLGGWCISITECTGQDYQPDSYDTCQGRFFTVSAYGQRCDNHYIAHNTTTGMTVDPDYFNQNTGEQIMWEFIDPIVEQAPVAVSETSFTFEKPFKNERVGWFTNAVITEGQGMGQYRQVRKYDPASGVIEIDRPWDIAPNLESRILICRTVNRAVVYSNRLNGKPRAWQAETHIASTGVEPFGGAIDLIVDGNLFHDTREGISLFSRPNFFHTYQNNRFEQLRWGIRARWQVQSGKPNPNFTGPAAFGVIGRNNTFKAILDYGILFDMPFCVFENNPGATLAPATPKR